jgi:uncharacterized membrane protein YoaK (UPF0700 family)
MISLVLFSLAFIVIIIWAVGFWVYHMGSIIHLTLVFAALFLIMAYSTWKKMKGQNEI